MTAVRFRVAQYVPSIKLVALAMPVLVALIQAQQPSSQLNNLSHQDQLYLQQQTAADRQQQQQQYRIAKIGLAPHERLSCQLKPLAPLNVQRRRQAADQFATSSSKAPLSAINAPNAMADDQQSSSNNSLIDQLIKSTSSNNDNKLVAEAQQRRHQAVQRAKLDSGERLRQLRQLLVSNNYDAYLVTPNDEHGSEYVTDYDKRLRFISGFTGSNGYALILLDRAVFFTDGRYALQAEADLDCNWWLVVGDDSLADIIAWLRSQGAKRLKVATDARLMTLQDFDYLEERFQSQLDQSEFALISRDLIDAVWDNLQNTDTGGAGGHPLAPPREMPSGKLQVQPLEFAGHMSWQEKLMRLVAHMDRLKARHYVISKLDDIAWLLNLRGSDIPMSPMFKSYLLISRFPTPASATGATATPASTMATAGLHSTTTGSMASPTLATSANGLAAGSDPARATPSTGQLGPITSLEHLLSTSGSSSSNNFQDSISMLQAPQVLQVPASQTIRVTLYVDLKKVTAQVREHLHLDNGTSYQQQQQQQQQSSADGSAPSWWSSTQLSRIQVELRDYDVFIMDFRNRFAGTASASVPTATAGMILGSGQTSSGGKLLLDAMANVAIHVLAKDYEDRLILVEPLVQRLKAVKTDLEVAGMRQAHWRDSLAIAMLLAQLEQDIGLAKKTHKWTEQSAARELEFYRSLMDYNRGQSFETISAYGANGAIVHYKPPTAPPPTIEDGLLDDHQGKQWQQTISNTSTFLLDSGGQYLDGTTDITRTVHFGQPSEFQRETYTRVLMGSIDMMSLIFNQGTAHLDDLLARRHLMELGLDYMHGTGHGIGSYSLVHEDPALIRVHSTSSSPAKDLSQRSARQKSKLFGSSSGSIVLNEQLPIQANMFTSVEPGYYKANDFGIRLENIVVTQRVQPQQQNSSGASETTTATASWLRFEPLSLVPFEPKLIKLELLSNKQKAWLNSYNLMVRLRMTQQINHYLTKMRQSASQQQQQTGQIQVLGTASSSRLYQQLKQASGPNSSLVDDQDSQLGRNNFLRLEAGTLQQLLEQAHKWIMAKTELIPLDVPQRLIKTTHCQQSTAATTAAVGARADGGAASQMNEQAADQWSALGTDPEGQRLMLAYMSGLPFNDVDAARAAVTLSARTGAPDQKHTSNDTSISSSLSSSSSWYQGQKCTGIECDLLLLEALNSHQQSLQNHHRHHQQKRAGSIGADEPQVDEPETGGGLMGLFQINSSGPGQGWWSMINVWPLLGLAVLLTLQLAVMAYVCAGGGRKATNDDAASRRSSSANRRTSAASSRRGSSGGPADGMPLSPSVSANQLPLSIVVASENV